MRCCSSIQPHSKVIPRNHPTATYSEHELPHEVPTSCWYPRESGKGNPHMAATRGVDVRGFSTVQHFPESIHRCLDAQHGSWPTDLVKGMSMSPFAAECSSQPCLCIHQRSWWKPTCSSMSSSLAANVLGDQQLLPHGTAKQASRRA